MAPNPLSRAMTCREVVECATLYLEESMQHSAKVSMNVHLAGCAGCRTYVDQIASVRAALKCLPGATMDFARRNRLRQAFRHGAV